MTAGGRIPQVEGDSTGGICTPSNTTIITTEVRKPYIVGRLDGYLQLMTTVVKTSYLEQQEGRSASLRCKSTVLFMHTLLVPLTYEGLQSNPM